MFHFIDGIDKYIGVSSNVLFNNLHFREKKAILGEMVETVNSAVEPVVVANGRSCYPFNHHLEQSERPNGSIS